MKDALELNGFFVIDRLLANPEIESLIEDFEAQRSSTGAHSLRNVHQSPVVQRTAYSKTVFSLAKEVLGDDARLVRAIYFDKLPEANWAVPWHQDLTVAVKERVETEGFGSWSHKDGVVHVQPPAAVLEDMVTIRIHLDSCGTENGPVRVKAGSHRYGKLPEDQIEGWQAPQVACTGESGSALIMRPLILHASSPAKTPSHRRVLHLEYAGSDLPHPLHWYLGKDLLVGMKA